MQAFISGAGDADIYLIMARTGSKGVRCSVNVLGVTCNE